MMGDHYIEVNSADFICIIIIEGGGFSAMKMSIY